MTKLQTEDSPQNYTFVLKRIDLIEKSLRIFNKKDKKVDYDYGISLQIIPSPSENQSFNIMSVKIFPKGQEKEIIATVRLGFVFEIFNLEKMAVKNEDGSVSLPSKLLDLLNAVVIGTMRGVLFSELRGTQLDDVILPVIDPSKFQREE
ncbi:MAG: hypothetical protein V4561_08285 [Bacteroidota bacterium]